MFRMFLLLSALLSMSSIAYDCEDLPPNQNALLTYEFGVGYSGQEYNNYDNNLAWGENYHLQGLIEKYQARKPEQNGATPNFDIPDKLLIHICRLLNKRDSVRQVHTFKPAWSFKFQVTQNEEATEVYDITVAANALISYPIAMFIELLQSDVTLQQRYPGVKEEFTLAVEQLISLFNSSWNSEEGWYQAPPKTSTYFLDSNGHPMALSGSYPHNLQAAIGRLLLTMAKVTNSENLKRSYYRKSQSIAESIKRAFIENPENGSYYWKYWAWDGDSQIEDYSHAILVMDFIKTAYQHGMVFNQQDIEKVALTFTESILPDHNQPFFTKLDKTQPFSGEPIKNYELYLWLPIAQYHPNSEQFIASIRALTSRLQSENIHLGYNSWQYLASVYYEIYVENNRTSMQCNTDSQCGTDTCGTNNICVSPIAVGQTCTRDTQCSSGLCRALGENQAVKQCIGKQTLAYGQKCRLDSECETNVCFAGVVCGYELGQSSTCYRDNECASGALLKCGVADSTLNTTNVSPILSCQLPGSKPYGAACLRDSECNTGICYNKHRESVGQLLGGVCGYPLGDGSTCYQETECASGYTCNKSIGAASGVCRLE